MLFWLAGVALMAVVFVPTGVVAVAQGDPAVLMFVFIPPTMLAFGLWLPWFGRRLGEGDKVELLEFLRSLAAPESDSAAKS
jgi:hypothetical protein